MGRELTVVDYDLQWPVRYQQEKAGIVAALGKITAGGVIENIQHIGSTSIPGMPAEPCLDIMMSAWPFPLENEAVAALELLNFTMTDETSSPKQRRFSKANHEVHLHVVESGSEDSTNYLLLREYLRANPSVARSYGETKRKLAIRYRRERGRYQEEKILVVARLLDKAKRWFQQDVGFAPLYETTDELREFRFPYMVSSGWALDLYLGHVTRVHQDVDITLYRRDQLELQTYMTERKWEFVAPNDQKLEPWPRHTKLELPRHQVHAHKDGRFIDFLLSEVEGDLWRFRRNPSIIRSLDRLALQTEEGLNYLAPEVVLLYIRVHIETVTLEVGTKRTLMP